MNSLTKISDNEENAVEIINHTIGNGWKGFVKPEKQSGHGGNNQQTGGGSKAERSTTGQKALAAMLFGKTPPGSVSGHGGY